MTRSSLIRSYISCVLLLAFAYTSSAVLLKRSIAGEIKPSFNTELAVLEKKLASVQPYLPSQGIIGYIDNDENVRKSAVAGRAFIMTQYILTPLVVVRDANKDLVLGNFSRRKMGLRIAEKYGLECIAHFDGGLMILQKKADRK